MKKKNIRSTGSHVESVASDLFSPMLRRIALAMPKDEAPKKKERKIDARILLTDDQVIEIRKKHQHDNWCCDMIFEHYGKLYGLTKNYIRSLLDYTTRSKLIVR